MLEEQRPAWRDSRWLVAGRARAVAKRPKAKVAMEEVLMFAGLRRISVKSSDFAFVVS